jgi:hypothetical protein
VQKAKSRLTTITQDKPVHPVIDSVAVKTKRKKEKFFLAKHFNHLPALFMAFFFYVILGIVVVNIDPSLVKDLILPSTYLPVLILVFVANFFLLSFLLLNSKRGLFYSSLITLITFLKFQNVIFELSILLILVLIAIFFELLFNIFRKLLKH